MEDFVKQMKTLRRLGPMKQLLGMLPGMGDALKNADIDEKQLDRLEGMVNSMTPDERRDAKVLNMPRRRRVAAGSGTSVDNVSQTVKRFSLVADMSRQFSGMGAKGKLAAARELQRAGGAGALGMGGVPGMSARKSTRQSSPKSRYKKKRKR